MTSYIGYHFTGDTLRDGSPIPPVGEKLVFDGEIEICKSGLHWSEHPLDALQYAPGKWLHLVECSGPVESENDKHVSRERTILKTINAEYLMRRFVADQALSVAYLWDMPSIMREYLTTLDETKWDAARNAAWAAAQDASWTAQAAAWAAAHDAAWTAQAAARAAQAAARDAAWAAVLNAARDAAQAAARAVAAVYDTAYNAAFEAARSDFQRRVDNAFGAAS